eukprot:326241-Pyramimonas_sp.AAC.1
MGSTEAPAVIFGDASGGPDTSDSRLRRVALGITTLSNYDDPTVECYIAGPPTGSCQFVGR